MLRVCLLLAATAFATPLVAADDSDTRATSVEFDADSGEWIEIASPVPGTPNGDLQIARNLHAQNKYKKALRAIKKWRKTYGDADDLLPQAVLLECAARVGLRDYYKAHGMLQEFLAEYAGTGYQERALTLEFVVAEVFLSGTKRKWLGVRMLKADDIGLAILDDIVTNYPQSRLAELATLTKANYYFQSGDFPFAEQEYGYLVESFTRSRYVRKSLLQSARAALASFPGVAFDDAPLIEAEERFSQYLTQYPGTAEQEGIGLILADIGETRAEKEYNIGCYYERTEKPRAAAFYFRSTITHWPETIAAVRAAEKLQAMGVPVEASSE